MKLSIVVGDVLDQAADALIVAIDGEVRSDEPVDRILGNIARQLVRRFAAHDVVDQIESQLDLPLALGRATSITLEALPWTTLVLVSTLHHTGAHDERDKRALVVRSFASALACCHAANARSVATAVLQGGWRMGVMEAFSAMLTAMDGSEFAGEIVLATPDATLADSLRAQARAVGW